LVNIAFDLFGLVLDMNVLNFPLDEVEHVQFIGAEAVEILYPFTVLQSPVKFDATWYQ
jgi:hypothetical protein